MQFQTFVTYAKFIAQMADNPFQDRPAFDLQWTLWLDPGTHTGLAAVLYATPREGANAIDLAEKLHVALERLHASQDGVRAGLPGEVVPGAPGATGAAIVGIWTELLYAEENQMVRQAISRVRTLGAALAGKRFWDVVFDPQGPRLGLAGVGAETFTVLKPQQDHEFLSPVRVRSAFSYALEDEFGIAMMGNSPGDAKRTFSDERLRRAGLYVSGPDHVRDALRHCLLSIRKTVLS